MLAVVVTVASGATHAHRHPAGSAASADPAAATGGRLLGRQRTGPAEPGTATERAGRTSATGLGGTGTAAAWPEASAALTESGPAATAGTQPVLAAGKPADRPAANGDPTG